MNIINYTGGFNYSQGTSCADSCAGDLMFDKNSQKIITYDGSNWVDLNQESQPEPTFELTYEETVKVREMLKDWERDKYPERFL